MSTEARIATSHPSAMWREARYWTSAWQIVAVFLAGSVVVALVTLEAYGDSGLQTYVALSFHLLTLAGLIVALRAWARVEVDEAIATTVEAKATRAVGDIKGGNTERFHLKQIEEDFLPHNPGHQDGTLSLFRHILHEAGDRKFHSSQALVQPLRERYAGDLHVMQSVQRLALQLGILFTFVGLILALSAFKNDGQTAKVESSNINPVAMTSPETFGDSSGALAGDSPRGTRSVMMEGSVGNRIDGMFGGLYTAFGTSVAGLEVAIIVGLMVVFLRRRQGVFFQRLDRAIASLTSLSRNAINTDFFHAELEQARVSMEGLSERVWDQSRELERHADEVRSGVERLVDLKLRFNEFLSGVQGEQKRVLEEMRSVYDIISPKAVAHDMQEGLIAAVGEVTRRVDHDLSKTLGQLEALEPALARLESLAVKSGEESDRRVQDLAHERAGLRSLRNELKAALDEISQLHEEALSRAGTPLDHYRSTVIDVLERSLSQSVHSVADRLNNIQRSLDAIQHRAELGAHGFQRTFGQGQRRSIRDGLRSFGRRVARLGRVVFQPWRWRTKGGAAADGSESSGRPAPLEAMAEEVEGR